MSALFGGPKPPKPLPIPIADQADAQAVSDKLRERLGARRGRQSTLLTATVDTTGSRPRADTLAG